MPNVDEVLEALRRGFTSWQQSERIRPDCCIPATKAAIAVCQHFGIQAEAFPVSIRVMNKAFAKAVDKGWLVLVGDKYQWNGAERYGTFFSKTVIHRERSADPERWFGHLVARLPDNQLLLDLSFGQFTEQERNLVTEPVVLSLDRQSSVPWTWDMANGNRTLIWPAPEKDDWEQTRIWNELGLDEKIDRLVNAVENQFRR